MIERKILRLLKDETDVWRSTNCWQILFYFQILARAQNSSLQYHRKLWSNTQKPTVVWKTKVMFPNIYLLARWDWPRPESEFRTPDPKLSYTHTTQVRRIHSQDLNGSNWGKVRKKLFTFLVLSETMEKKDVAKDSPGVPKVLCKVKWPSLLLIHARIFPGSTSLKCLCVTPGQGQCFCWWCKGRLLEQKVGRETSQRVAKTTLSRTKWPSSHLSWRSC